jgi:hypothetical protein
MSDKKAEFDITTLVPWGVAIVLGYMLWTKDATPGPTPDPKPITVTLEKATSGIYPTIRSENARIFYEAAKKIRSKEIQFDKQLFDYVNAATKAAREAANKPFDVAFEATLPRDEEGSFLNMEEQAAKVLERIAKSW